jgi:hypothetical protein
MKYGPSSTEKQLGNLKRRGRISLSDYEAGVKYLVSVICLADGSGAEVHRYKKEDLPRNLKKGSLPFLIGDPETLVHRLEPGEGYGTVLHTEKNQLVQLILRQTVR